MITAPRLFAVLMVAVLVPAFEARPQSVLEEVRALKDVWKYESAVAILEDAIASGNNDAALHFELADCLYLSGRYDKALPYFDSILEENPGNLHCLTKKMSILYQTREYDDCISAGRQILQKDTIKTVLSLIGDSFRKINNIDSAAVYYCMASAVDPDDSRIVAKLCDIYTKGHKYEDLAKVSESFLSRHPNHPTIGPYKGLSYFLRGQYAYSSQIFSDLLNSGVDGLGVHYYAGLCKYHLQQYEEARTELELVCSVDSTKVEAIVYLADLRTRTNADFNGEVMPLFERAIAQMQPDSSMMFSIYSTLADDCILAGEGRQAIVYYGKSLEYNPDSYLAYYNMGNASSMERKYEDAIKYYEKFISRSKGRSPALVEYVTGRIDDLKGELFMHKDR